jgi:hypothetical protein
MPIVIEEIVSEVIPPSTERAASGSRTSKDQAPGGITSQSDLQQALERIKTRQLRLMAD